MSDQHIQPHAEADNPQRIIALDGAVNFRDLGGYTTADGRTTRWGQLYRAAKLTNLTDVGVEALAALDVQTIYDVRSGREVAEEPDRLPTHHTIDHRHRPIVDPAHLSNMRLLFNALFRRNNVIETFRESYTRIVLDGNALIVGEVLTAIADPACRPLVFHCAAGKDRTGVISAILLDLLGVPRESVIADYALSNHYADHLRQSLKHNPHVRRLRLPLNKLEPLVLAEPVNLHRMYGWLDTNYGSAEQYVLARTGVDAAVIEQLRTELLA